MSDKILDKVFSYIDAIAAKLGVATEYVIAMLVRQQIIEGIVYTIMIVLFASVFAITEYKMIKHTVTNWETICENDMEEGWITGCVAFGVACLVMAIISAVVLPDQIMKILNPQYYALKDILGMITGSE